MPMIANGYPMAVSTQLSRTWSTWMCNLEILLYYMVGCIYHCLQIVAKERRENKEKTKLALSPIISINKLWNNIIQIFLLCSSNILTGTKLVYSPAASNF